MKIIINHLAGDQINIAGSDRMISTQPITIDRTTLFYHSNNFTFDDIFH